MKTGVSGAIARKFLHSKLTPLLTVASIFAGIAGLATTPREEEPQIRVPMIDVAVGFVGATPREVERRIVEPLERLIWEVPGVEYVYSASYADGALVTARYEVGTEPEAAVTRMWSKIFANVDKIPPGATQPFISLHGINEVPILTITLSGGSDAGDGYLLRQQAGELVRELKRIPNIAETWVIGGAPRELTVTLNPQALAVRGLSAGAVAGVITSSNDEFPGGDVVNANTNVPFRLGNLIRNREQVEQLVIGISGDRPILLSDVAEVRDGPAEPVAYVEFLSGGTEGEFEPAVTIAVAKREGTNAATLAHQVEERLHTLTGSVISNDVNVTITRDYGETATEKSRELLLHIMIATFGVVLLVWLALGWREAVVVLVAVPVTLALTLLVYRLYGYTLNRITLFALVFAIGILVDDAIVVVENIARHIRTGKNTLVEAAVLGVDEVGNPTILATLTVIAAILPMAFVSGLMGPYMRPIPVGASVAMVFSLAVAFVVTPYLAVRLIKEKTPTGSNHEGLPDGRLARRYRQFFESLVDSSGKRTFVYAVMVVMLLGAVLLVPARLVTVKMLPFDNKSEFQLIIDMPESTTLERTAEVTKTLALAVVNDEAISNIQTYVGTAAPFNFNGLVRHYFLRKGPTVADIQVNLYPKDERDASSHEIALRLRPIIDSIASANGASVKLAEIPPGPPVLATLTAEVYGPTPQARMSLARGLKSVFEGTEGVVDVDWSVESSHDQLRAVIGQAELARAGSSTEEAVGALVAGLGGFTAGLLHDDEAAEDIPIRLRMSDAASGSEEELSALPLSTPGGARLLGTFSSFQRETAPQPIFHKNLRPVIYVTADVAGALESPAYAMIEMTEAIEALDGGTEVYWASSPTVTEDAFVVWDGEWQITYEVFRDLGIAFAAVLVLIYFLVVAWFQSFSIPLVIMAPIPLTLVGILPAHALTGAFFTATSMIGMIALAGIIVRNSILLVDFIELGLENGATLKEAVVASGMIRARPIILTAAAVVIGGAVMVTDPIFQGLGVAMISGAIVATGLTLVAIPLLYYEISKK